MTKGQRIAAAAAVLIGTAAGLGAFTFVYAKGYSYLTTDPAACANCHIMDEHYSAWLKSSHRNVAGCNDCHTPHDLVGKYATKAKNGFWHSFYFTTGNFPYPLRITGGNKEIVEGACRSCHEGITSAMNHGGVIAPPGMEVQPAREEIACTHCHEYVGHWVR
ncbi:MAG TPA: cytochrome c nitrite reductase small subunit [Longimicrobiaceae bacterium]|nr:cytochrome c nitrite reductase small subunit [Longimicrobiaceae bacterium]